MQYLDRTLQVKAALLERPDLLERIRNLFHAHVEGEPCGEEYEPMGRGNTRLVYEVGKCEIASGAQIVVLLKLKKEPSYLKYSFASKRSRYSDWNEFGAFELYYDFIVGHISSISFRTKAGHKRYLRNILGTNIPHTFSLAEGWGGTVVDQGDVGAIPYFQMAVRYGKWFGHLTEGLPPLVEPKYTAECRGYDDYTVEDGRIIDLGTAQRTLIRIDRGGGVSSAERYPNNLGVRLRGEKYFKPTNRLDL